MYLLLTAQMLHFCLVSNCYQYDLDALLHFCHLCSVNSNPELSSAVYCLHNCRNFIKTELRTIQCRMISSGTGIQFTCTDFLDCCLTLSFVSQSTTKVLEILLQFDQFVKGSHLENNSYHVN